MIDIIKKLTGIARKHNRKSAVINVSIEGTADGEELNFQKTFFSILDLVSFLKKLHAEALRFKDAEKSDKTKEKFPVLYEVVGWEADVIVIKTMKYEDSLKNKFLFEDIDKKYRSPAEILFGLAKKRNRR